MRSNEIKYDTVNLPRAERRNDVGVPIQVNHQPSIYHNTLTLISLANTILGIIGFTCTQPPKIISIVWALGMLSCLALLSPSEEPIIATV